MKVFLTAFGLHNPCAGPRLQEHNVMPIATDVDGGLDLDYSSLLIAETFVIDRTALEFVRDRRQTFLGPMCHSLDVLEGEGLLEVADYAEICRPFEEQIRVKAERLLEPVEPWLAIAREQWSRVETEFAEFGHRYSTGPLDADFNRSHYGVVAFLEQRDGRIDVDESRRLHDLLATKRMKLKSSERIEMQAVLKPLVAQVLINDLLRQRLQAPFIDWDDAQGFYNRLYLPQWTELSAEPEPSSAVATQARCLFDLVLPELLPGRIEDVVKFIHNRKAVVSLRHELWSLMRQGDSVSSDWMLRLHTEATEATLRAEDRGRVIKWVGRVAGLVMPGGNLLSDVLLGAAEEGADRLNERPLKNRFEWYYALQRIRMERDPE